MSSFELDDAILLQQVGIYEYHHPLENAAQYKEALTAIRQEVKEFIKNGKQSCRRNASGWRRNAITAPTR